MHVYENITCNWIAKNSTNTCFKNQHGPFSNQNIIDTGFSGKLDDPLSRFTVISTTFFNSFVTFYNSLKYNFRPNMDHFWIKSWSRAVPILSVSLHAILLCKVRACIFKRLWQFKDSGSRLVLEMLSSSMTLTIWIFLDKTWYGNFCTETVAYWRACTTHNPFWSCFHHAIAV